MNDLERVAVWDVRKEIDHALECLRVGTYKVARPDTASDHLRKAVKLLGELHAAARPG